jgi:arylsulfatase A-like enzyme
MFQFHSRSTWLRVLSGAGFLALITGAVTAQTLLHHWKLDGDATDSAGSADGTVSGGTAVYAAGQFGQAISLDGIDDHITANTGGAAIVPATDYTLSAWVYWDDGDDRGRIAGGQSGGTVGEVFTLSRSTAAQGGTDLRLFLNLLPDGLNSFTVSPDNTISTGAWMHVAYTVDSTNGTTIFLNGTPVGTNPLRTTHTPDTAFAIGARPGGTQDLFDGLIDDVAIFDGVLTAAQLDNVKTTGAANFDTPALVHHWKLDETSGQTAADSAGSADGTLGTTAGIDASDPAVNRPGKFGTAYEFNETELDRVTISDLGSAGSLSVGTITGWFKTDPVAPGFRGVLFRYGDSTATDRIILEMRDDGKLRLILRNNNSNSIELFAAAAYDDGSWHHFAITQDGTAAKLHVDGTELTGAALATNITSGDWFTVLADTADSMSIGWEVRAGPSHFPFGGLIDDVAIFNGPLNSTQINNARNNGAESYNTDTTAPLITLKDPADDQANVSRGANIIATFDDHILAGAGDIVIKDLEDGSTTRTIPVTDSSQVTIAGNLLIINPTNPLAEERDYSVQIAPGAVRNSSGLDFAGIPADDDTSWNFETRAASPNVIFILGDDQAWYDYSFMRRPGIEQTAIDMNTAIYQVAQTPAIDRLADEGLTFTHGYATPICRPSLASIITGAFPHQTRVTGNDLVGDAPDQAVEARMQVLHPLSRTLVTELGYTCFQTGKWWEGNFANGGFTHGDTVNSIAGGTAPPQWSGGRPGYVTARHGDWGLMTGRVDYVNDIAAPADPIPYANTIETVTDFIDAQVTAEQPFFLWYAPFLPHTPHDPPAGLVGKYDALISEPNESGNYFAKYYANIERFDGGVGAILDHLDARGIADNTIVVMICDNGWINQTELQRLCRAIEADALRGRHQDPDHRPLARPHQGGWRHPATGHHHAGQPGRHGAHHSRRTRPAHLPRDDRAQPA